MHKSPPFAEIIGIFARTFTLPNLADILDHVQANGFRHVQLNLASAGLETLPDLLTQDTCAWIANLIQSRGLTLSAVSGTFNMIDPDLARRADNLRRLEVLASACRWLDTRIITLCTGTCDCNNMWRYHSDNDSPKAWAELVSTMKLAVQIAEAHQVTLAFEPEIANVVDTSVKARKLLDEIQSPWLKVVLDPANLLRPADIPQMCAIIDEAFHLLANDTVLIHAKELAADGSTGELAPGQGVLNFAHVFWHYHRLKLEIPVIMHGLPAVDVKQGNRHLMEQHMQRVTTSTFSHDKISFHYQDTEHGLPVVFQHGLGGDLTVPWGLYQPQDGVRLISFDARFHGETRPLCDPAKLNFDTFADDLLALLDHLGIEKAVVGGISMGAGLALNFAIRYPTRTLGLILSRPAWLDKPFPENVRMFPIMATFIRQLGWREGLEAFKSTPTYANVLAQSSDSIIALVGMFENPRALETVDKLERIPACCPSLDLAAWKSIAVPTLILGNEQDPIHPLFMAEDLATNIPNATLRLLTPKCISITEHTTDVQNHMSEFLDMHFLKASG